MKHYECACNMCLNLNEDGYCWKTGEYVDARYSSIECPYFEEDIENEN